MVDLALPEGNRLTFKYDEFARLLEETDFDALGQMTRDSFGEVALIVRCSGCR
jgi:YD repeat-containing protein